MNSLDELREQFRIKRGNWQSITPPENYAKDRARGLTDAIVILDAFEANACDGCRHWRGGPGSAVLGRCCVSGSFRAPGGLFTEGGFCCCHWTKS